VLVFLFLISVVTATGVAFHNIEYSFQPHINAVQIYNALATFFPIPVEFYE